MIGRKPEQQLLDKAFKAREAQFIAVYGRRRVGKTWLVREFLAAKKCRTLQATGLQNGTVRQQLANFAEALAAAFAPGVKLETPATWLEAFKQLTAFLASAGTKEKTVIFLDEFPWMATRKSGLLQATDYYWNHHWSRLNSFILVICGSSASWLIKNLIHNKGGLHNRITGSIRLEPFNLAETAELLAAKKLRLNHRQVLKLYMALGGIPYYLNYVEAGLSAEQNIQQIFFSKNAALRDEFDQVFGSLFETAEAYVELATLIGAKKEGVTRSELVATARLSPGGGQLSDRLEDLRAAGFVQEMTPWGRSKGEYYKLVDQFSLFYLRWVQPVRTKRLDRKYWTSQSGKPAFKTWSGYAFETVCLQHIEQIFAALRVPAGSTAGTWRFIPRRRLGDGAQIDLLIDRPDDAITLCEIKYSGVPFRIDKQYAKNLQTKAQVFKSRTGTQKQIFIALISAEGVQKSMYSAELLSAQVTADDLFAAE
jgi:uncharacterized protein